MRGGKIFSGNAHLDLAERVCEHLGTPLSAAKVSHFSNRETSVQIVESVREEHVYLIQTGMSENVNDGLMELLILANSCRTASAKRVIAVIPFLFYSKQCKTKQKRGAIPAKLVANMLRVAGVDHVIMLDIHSDIVQGFFDFPVDNLWIRPLFVTFIRQKYPKLNVVIVAKGAGGAKLATAYADALGVDFAIIHKEEAKEGKGSKLRPFSSPKPARKETKEAEGTTTEENETKADEAGPSSESLSAPSIPTPLLKRKVVLVGDVAGKVAILVDDLIDNAKSACAASFVLRERGATAVHVLATHGVLSGNSLELINDSRIDEVTVTNSVDTRDKMQRCARLNTIDVSHLFAEAIRRYHHGESLTFLRDFAPIGSVKMIPK